MYLFLVNLLSGVQPLVFAELHSKVYSSLVHLTSLKNVYNLIISRQDDYNELFEINISSVGSIFCVPVLCETLRLRKVFTLLIFSFNLHFLFSFYGC